jgi:DNA-binding NarL/FixJ family response regulator
MSNAKGRPPLHVCIIEANPLAEKHLVGILRAGASIQAVDLELVTNGTAAKFAPPIFLIDNCSLPLPLSEYLRRLRYRCGESKYMVLDRRLTKEQIFRMLWFGIDGYLAYDDVSRLLVTAIQSLASGNIWIPREILRDFIKSAKESKEGGSNRPEGLTFREAQIIELVNRRLSNKEIAEALRIRESTVKFHLSNIFSKLQVGSRHDILEATPSLGMRKLIPNPATAGG